VYRVVEPPAILLDVRLVSYSVAPVAGQMEVRPQEVTPQVYSSGVLADAPGRRMVSRDGVAAAAAAAAAARRRMSVSVPR
jgi:hypothetical protein